MNYLTRNCPRNYYLHSRPQSFDPSQRQGWNAPFAHAHRVSWQTYASFPVFRIFVVVLVVIFFSCFVFFFGFCFFLLCEHSFLLEANIEYLAAVDYAVAHMWLWKLDRPKGGRIWSPSVKMLLYWSDSNEFLSVRFQSENPEESLHFVSNVLLKSVLLNHTVRTIADQPL